MKLKELLEYEKNNNKEVERCFVDEKEYMVGEICFLNGDVISKYFEGAIKESEIEELKKTFSGFDVVIMNKEVEEGENRYAVQVGEIYNYELTKKTCGYMENINTDNMQKKEVIDRMNRRFSLYYFKSKELNKFENEISNVDGSEVVKVSVKTEVKFSDGNVVKLRLHPNDEFDQEKAIKIATVKKNQNEIEVKIKELQNKIDKKEKLIVIIQDNIDTMTNKMKKLNEKNVKMKKIMNNII